MTKFKTCRKCRGTGVYCEPHQYNEGSCWSCAGTGKVKDETIVEMYADRIERCFTQGSLDATAENLPFIKNLEHRAAIAKMVEAKRPGLPTEAWLGGLDIEGRERTGIRRARQKAHDERVAAYWAARKAAEKGGK